MKKRRSSSSSPSPEGPGGKGLAPFIESTAKGVFIRVRLAPRASRERVEGVHDGALKIRITAPPVEGEANRALVAFLSGLLGLPKGAFSIQPGSLKSKNKKVKVEGATAEELSVLIGRALG
ncbi:MAG: DUF167 domain-containing protein [Thermodesulfobacteriota bacterium]